MKFRFTHHAQYRLFMERNISADEIKAVIREPDESRFLPNGAVKCSKQLEKNTLVVVYAKERGEYVIITAYFK